MQNQRTVQREIVLSGTSLMLGASVDLTILPAAPDEGIAFERLDVEGTPSLGLSDSMRVEDIPHCTSIGRGDLKVHGIEHLLSAFAGCGIDNARVQLNGPEPPSFDGSARPITDAIHAAGLVTLDAPRRQIQLDDPIILTQGTSQIIAQPAESFRVSFLFDYPNGPTQYAEFDLSQDDYASEIAPARTFCFKHEVEALRSLGLGKGAVEGQNVLVVNREGRPNTELRYPDELVRHKILDLMGDLYLLGQLPQAHITCLRSGHALNSQLATALKEYQHGKLEEPVDVIGIYDLLEHRYPFCMVDRIIEVEEAKRAVGIKNVSFNELYFQGHFPGRPVMPAVLQLEALAQTAGYLVKRIPEHRCKLGYFAAMDNVRFRSPVVPGDQLRLEVVVLKLRSKYIRVRGIASVEGQIATEAEFSIFLAEDRADT